MTMRRLLDGLSLAACLTLLWGCATIVPTPPSKAVPDPPLGRFISTPAGWIDVSERALSPDVEYWLLADDNSASLLLKEIQASMSTGTIPETEPILTLAHLSLRLKIAELGAGIRITQVPAVPDSSPRFAMYSYAENGLLRRVVVFRKRSRLYELELAQESEAGTFSRHLPAQLAFAMSVLTQ